MQAATPPLPPEHLDRLRTLTRDYARLSSDGAGLGQVLGGGFLLFLAALEVVGHGSRLTLLGAFAPLPAGRVLALGALPFLWLAARAALGHWWRGRHGAVLPLTPPESRRRLLVLRVGRWLLPAGMLLGLVPLLLAPVPLRAARAALVLLLAATLAWIWPRWVAQGRLERMLCVLIFFGPALQAAGIQMAAGDTLLAFPLVGLAAVALGTREHLAFRRLRRELAGRA